MSQAKVGDFLKENMTTVLSFVLTFSLNMMEQRDLVQRFMSMNAESYINY